MKIEVWSDFVCPFCYIGKRQLEKAIKDTGFEGKVEVVYKSYLIDPEAPVDSTLSFLETLAKKYEMSNDEVQQMTNGISEKAAEVGLDYNFDIMKTANTLKAHRLAKWAAKFGKEAALTERLMQAYFTAGAAIGQDEVLLKMVDELELDVKEAASILQSDAHQDEVAKDLYEARQIEVSSVPFFVFHNKFGIIGAEPQEVFEKTIRQAAEAAGIQPKIQIIGSQENSCTDGSCKI